RRRRSGTRRDGLSEGGSPFLLDFEDGGSGKGGKVDRFTGMGGYPGWENGGATGFGRCGGGCHRQPGGGGGDRLERHPEPETHRLAQRGSRCHRRPAAEENGRCCRG